MFFFLKKYIDKAKTVFCFWHHIWKIALKNLANAIYSMLYYRKNCFSNSYFNQFLALKYCRFNNQYILISEEFQRIFWILVIFIPKKFQKFKLEIYFLALTNFAYLNYLWLINNNVHLFELKLLSRWVHFVERFIRE